METVSGPTQPRIQSGCQRYCSPDKADLLSFVREQMEKHMQVLLLDGGCIQRSLAHVEMLNVRAAAAG